MAEMDSESLLACRSRYRSHLLLSLVEHIPTRALFADMSTIEFGGATASVQIVDKAEQTIKSLNTVLEEVPSYMNKQNELLQSNQKDTSTIVGLASPSLKALNSYVNDLPDFIRQLREYFLFLPTFFNLMIDVLNRFPEHINQLTEYFALLPVFFNLANDYLRELPKYPDQLKNYFVFLPAFFNLINEYLRNLPRYFSEISSQLAFVSKFFGFVNDYLSKLPEYGNQLKLFLAPIPTFFESCNGYLSSLPGHISQIGEQFAGVSTFLGLGSDYLRQLSNYLPKFDEHLAVVWTFFTLINEQLSKIPQYITGLGDRLAVIFTFFTLANDYLANIGQNLAFVSTFFHLLNEHLSKLPSYIAQLSGNLTVIGTFFTLINGYLMNIGSSLAFVPEFFTLVNAYLVNIGTNLAYIPTFFGLINQYLEAAPSYIAQLGTNLAFIRVFIVTLTGQLDNFSTQLSQLGQPIVQLGAQLAIIPLFFGLIVKHLEAAPAYISQLGANLVFLRVFFTTFTEQLSNLPGQISQLGTKLTELIAQWAVIPVVFDLLRSFLASLPDQITKLGGQLAIVPALLQSINSYLQAVTTSLEALDPDKLKAYCSMFASAEGMGFSTSLFSPTNVPVGVPVTLTALAPSPGTTLPAVGDLPASLLPQNAVVTFQWHITLLEQHNGQGWWKKKSSVSKDLRPGKVLNDLGGAFDIVTGSLTSPTIEIVPWPDPAHLMDNENVQPCPNKRGFCAYVDISFWWPGLSLPRKISTDSIYFSIPSWRELLPGKYDTASKAWVWDFMKLPKPSASVPVFDISSGATDSGVFFRDIFQLTADSLEPDVGEFVTLGVKHANSKPQLPQTVTSLVQNEPNIHMQAGIDIGALINNVENVVQGARGKTSKQSGEAMAVSTALSNALSIPLAMALTGTNMTKTIVPNSPITLPNIDSSTDGSALSGIIPIGNLMTRLEASPNEENLVIDGATDMVRLGCKLLPVPILTSFDEIGSLGISKATIAVKLKAQLFVPGAVTPINMLYSLGNLTITRPMLPVPQLALMFHDALDMKLIQEILIVPDPSTKQALPSAHHIKNKLNKLRCGLESLTKVPTVTSKMPGIQALADTVSEMVEMIQNADQHNQKISYINGYDFNGSLYSPGAIGTQLPPDYWLGQVGGSDSIEPSRYVSSLLWVGAPGKEGHRMYLGLNDYSKNFGRLAFPTASEGIYSIKFRSPSEFDHGVYFSSFDQQFGLQYTKSLDPTGELWNNYIKWVEWRRVSSAKAKNPPPAPGFVSLAFSDAGANRRGPSSPTNTDDLAVLVNQAISKTVVAIEHGSRTSPINTWNMSDYLGQSSWEQIARQRGNTV